MSLLRVIFAVVAVLACLLPVRAQRLHEPIPGATARELGAIVEDRSYDVEYYDLDLRPLLATRSIEGVVRIRFHAAEAALATIRLDLHRALTVDSVTGDAAGFERSGDTLVALLAEPLDSGGRGDVVVHYHGPAQTLNGRKGLRFTTHAGAPLVYTLSTPYLAHYWFPCNDGPGDKADSVAVTIRIPSSQAGLTAISNGVLVSDVVVGGERVVRWEHRYPIVPYYVMFAVGPYVSISGSHPGLGMPLVYHVFADHRAAAEQGVRDVPAMIDFLGALFGTYPFAGERFGMTQIDGTFGGAIENQTNVVTDSMSKSWSDITLHELSHQWFGDMITCRDWHHGWLNEGFATYCEALWTEHTQGPTAYHLRMWWNEWLAPGTLYLQQTGNPLTIFQPIIYLKGACVLHMLRGMYGDSIFFRGLRSYADDPALRFRHATTEDFQAHMERAAGDTLGTFFQQWVYDQGYPRYRSSATQNSATGVITIGIEQTQRDLGFRDVFTMPVPVRLHFRDERDTVVMLRNDRRLQSWEIPARGELVSAVIDPDRWILRDIDSSSMRTSAGFDGGITIIEPVIPNPVRDGAIVRWSLARAGRATLRLYDSRGAVVRTLLARDQRSAGRHQLIWDGRDEHGVPVEQGAYFLRLDSGEGGCTVGVVVLAP